MVGTKGEECAAEYLEKKGYRILTKNFSCKLGEIDIIAKHLEYTVFIEVKYRKDIKKGYPIEAVNFYKQKRIIKTAMYYAQNNNLFDTPIRFDIVEIIGNNIRVIQNAFQMI